MDWLRENWFWIVVFGFFVWMHVGHGHAHGGGRHAGSRLPRAYVDDPDREENDD